MQVHNFATLLRNYLTLADDNCFFFSFSRRQRASICAYLFVLPAKNVTCRILLLYSIRLFILLLGFSLCLFLPSPLYLSLVPFPSGSADFHALANSYENFFNSPSRSVRDKITHSNKFCSLSIFRPPPHLACVQNKYYSRQIHENE